MIIELNDEEVALIAHDTKSMIDCDEDMLNFPAGINDSELEEIKHELIVRKSIISKLKGNMNDYLK